jgi:glycerol-3-phosphate acyltransferase PlsY
MWWSIIIKIVIAYLLGSVMGSLVLGRVLGGADVRTQGSGNAGATNALRTRGTGFGLGVFLVDIAKGLLAVLLVPVLPFGDAAPAWLALACGVAVTLGHIYPVFFGFRGGKGVATLTGVFAGVLPLALPLMFSTWVVALVLSGWVSLASILAGIAAIIFVIVWGPQGVLSALGAFTVVMAALVVFTHRTNIARIARGQEGRFEKVMLLRTRHEP